MPKIKQYTRETLPSQMADPNAFGANQSGAMQQGEQIANIGAQVQKAGQEQSLRLDTIARARELSQFQEEMQNEFIRVEQEGDLTDPTTAKQYNSMVRNKVAEYASKHGGSRDSAVKFETQLMGVQDRLTTTMANNAVNAQKAFITNIVGEQVSGLSKKAYNQPESITDIYTELNAVFDEFSPAMDDVTQLGLIESAQEQISTNVLNAFIDVGNFEKAKGFINENPLFMNSMRPETQTNYLRTIQKGIDSQNAEKNKMVNKANQIRSVADELGVDIPASSVLTAVTGITNAQTPEQKVEEFRKVAKLNDEQLTPAVIAKIGYGVDFPTGPETNMNKDRLPDGGYTPKGIGVAISKPFEQASAIKSFEGKVNGAIDLFKKDGNSQALLSAMISFQKALDDGAVVREGDIVLQRSAQSLSDRISTVVAQAQTGQVVGDQLVDQMKSTMADFSRQTLESTKTFIDPYLQEAQERGYRMIDIGLPRQAYDDVFGGVKTKDDKSGAMRGRVESLAKQNGMSVDEMFEATALSSGKSVEDVKKDFGWNN